MPWRRYIKATIKLIDYAVRPPGSSSDALCETIITWTNNEKNLKLEDWILIKQ
jgi:hypothetical protein